jgi:Fic family protein
VVDQFRSIHLAAYALWRLNWIHPFADGNGRASRILSYVILSLKSDLFLPADRTIFQQMAESSERYYAGLEYGDYGWTEHGALYLSNLELMFQDILATQLESAQSKGNSNSVI